MSSRSWPWWVVGGDAGKMVVIDFNETRKGKGRHNVAYNTTSDILFSYLYASSARTLLCFIDGLQ